MGETGDPLKEHTPAGPFGHGLGTNDDYATISDRHGCEVSLAVDVAVLTARSILLRYRPELLAWGNPAPADEGRQ